MSIDVVIPTVAGREASLRRLLASLPEAVTPIVVDESKTCGWGWKQGMQASRADYILLACDDQEFLGGRWMEVCTQTADAGKLACPRVWMGDGTIESQGGDMDAFRHVIHRPQRDMTPVDYTTIPFMSAEQAEAIGMLDVHYASDVWVSYRGRQLGYETVLRHGYDVRHWHEQPGRGAGMSQNERDAMDCATVFESSTRWRSPHERHRHRRQTGALSPDRQRQRSDSLLGPAPAPGYTTASTTSRRRAPRPFPT